MVPVTLRTAIVSAPGQCTDRPPGPNQGQPRGNPRPAAPFTLCAMGADVLARNNVTVSGNPAGRPMLFAHGFGCDQNMWRYVWPAFADEHRVVLFDYVGAGGSDLTAY